MAKCTLKILMILKIKLPLHMHIKNFHGILIPMVYIINLPCIQKTTWQKLFVIMATEVELGWQICGVFSFLKAQTCACLTNFLEKKYQYLQYQICITRSITKSICMFYLFCIIDVNTFFYNLDQTYTGLNCAKIDTP